MKKIKILLGVCALVFFMVHGAHAACPDFAAVGDVTTETFPGSTLSVIAADFDGDGKIDLVGTTDRNSVSMFPGNSDGTLASESAPARSSPVTSTRTQMQISPSPTKGRTTSLSSSATATERSTRR